MPDPLKRRQAPRILLGARHEARTQDDRPVGLVDLTTGGARLTCTAEHHPGSTLTLHLPPGLGGGALGARVVWTSTYGSVQTLEGGRRRLYQSGVAFVGLTPGQRASLEGVVEQLEWDEILVPFKPRILPRSAGPSSIALSRARRYGAAVGGGG